MSIFASSAANERSVYLLILASILFAAVGSCFVTATFISSARLVESTLLVGVPSTLYYLATSVGALINPKVVNLHGRKTTLWVAFPAIACGGLLSWYALEAMSFGLFATGAVLIGLGAGLLMSLRFYAVDLASPDKVVLVISIVTGSGLIGNLIGPMLASLGDFDDLGIAFLVISCIGVLGLVIASPIKNVTLEGGTSIRFNREELVQAYRHRSTALATLNAGIAWFMMTSIMVSGPHVMLQLQAESSSISMSMQAHFLAMFIPVLLASKLVALVGMQQLVRLAYVLLGVTIALPLAFGQNILTIAVIMITVGLGWGVLIVFASTQIAQVAPAQKVMVQSFHDSLTILISAFAAGFSGWLAQAYGLTALAVLNGMALLMFVLLRFRVARLRQEVPG